MSLPLCHCLILFIQKFSDLVREISDWCVSLAKFIYIIDCDAGHVTYAEPVCTCGMDSMQ